LKPTLASSVLSAAFLERANRFFWGESMGSTRLLIADDHELIRVGLRHLLEEQPGWKVIAEAQDGREAVAMAKELRPDVAIMDIAMPLLNGVEASRQILAELPRTQILILSVHESDAVIRQVLDIGVRAYLFKSDASRDLVAAVNAVRDDKPFFSGRVAQLLLDGYLGLAEREGDGNGSRLTARQREIVQLLAEGKTSRDVARILNVSVKTAETHRANIMHRLRCHSVSEIVRYAMRNAMIEA
jgi:DNA-binding NarL/FixJ family response regulator